jgi:hypothetical protein
MSKTVWQKLGSPELIPSTITLRAYDGRPSSPEGLFENVLIELGGKTILIDIKVISAPLDYNILFGRSYMYTMKDVASSVFRTMMFPHNGKIITIDQVSHYELNHYSNIDNILPLVHTNSDAYPLVDMGPRISKDPSLLGTYHGAPPLIHPSTQVRVVSSNETDNRDTIPPTEASILIDIKVIGAPLDYNILFGRSYMYTMKDVASSVFRTMMFPHNGKIITIDQVSHYELNHYSNIDNILPLVHTNSDAYPLVDMGPRISKDPSLLGTYHGAPPLIHPSTQVCVVSSNKTDNRDTIPPTEASPLPDIPLMEEILPQQPPENPPIPHTPDFTLPQGQILVWETIPQAITQIPFFYPPPGIQAF